MPRSAAAESGSTGPLPPQVDLWRRPLAFVQRHAGPLLLLVLAAGTAGVLWHLQHTSENLNRAMALQSADIEARTVLEFRDACAAEVLPRAEHAGLKAVPDPAADESVIP